ncbi:MAG: hypothetical protein IPK80_15660 [Nannocystis sp.]|nr:hypothetical protein [Nannocystis sp.]
MRSGRERARSRQDRDNFSRRGGDRVVAPAARRGRWGRGEAAVLGPPAAWPPLRWIGELESWQAATTRAANTPGPPDNTRRPGLWSYQAQVVDDLLRRAASGLAGLSAMQRELAAEGALVVDPRHLELSCIRPARP